jgi:hypothetical protein
MNRLCLLLCLLHILFSQKLYAVRFTNTEFKYFPKIIATSSGYAQLAKSSELINDHLIARDASSLDNFWMPLEEAKAVVQLSQNVFEAITGTGKRGATAFALGDFFVLTNRHVIANDHLLCGQFAIIDKNESVVKCKKVIACSTKSLDFCLVQMEKKISSGINIPCLEESTNIDSSQSVLIIGNSRNFGIQASSWKGIASGWVKVSENARVHISDSWLSMALSFSGDSGAPIFNEQEKIIGIHKGRHDYPFEYVFPRSTFFPRDGRIISIATKSSEIIELIKPLNLTINANCGY